MPQKTKGILLNIGVQIIIAMIIGIIVGLLMKEQASMFEPLGTIFIHLIKMLVVPLIAISIISGAASLGGTSSAGKIGISTFAFFLITSAFAVLLALGMGEYFKPGSGIDLTTVKHMFSNEYADKGEIPGFFETIIGIIPTNVFQSLTSANILQILFFCLFLGIAISKLEKEKSAPLINGLNALVEAFIWMINIVMKFAPIGVFGLMADAIGQFGFDILKVITNLVVVYMIAILIFGFLFFPALVKLFSSLSPKKFILAMKKPQTVALSTASSMGTLPVTMEVCEDELKVSKSTSSFVLPLGATINMSGNAIYYGLAAIFFAQVFHINLGFAEYGAIILTATIGAIGQAGVPGPSFLVVAVLIAANIPIEGLPLLFAVDRIFDMTRTALNITGDAACAVIIDDNFNKEKI
ncbi:dicarboxylate/amino acid:cation symporter [Malaciobacter molluscorum LMG 25693]|uniref:Dicarboxylate/amino acid:cation symporter n=1 Tax=Malaciobacter molluscorum LMG 25693 TaxID=870501 RepID=A0A2G1DKS9_9BACT|nr:dicarboxylate/amino acid:cation symporter [Malaciobacter molluscorum]AXX92659.1 sodium:dicarboxylate symporter, SDF family [Malaciobacter molluscorum LMG 25693]PHO19081.1 dicarboxylate/amino acid:cation symporter [Malaciobacter molluscorum LMG 25693]RXJ97387.1 dicarboxylate/amino acid:cation symporter [Malaciobacter molluscorum]